MAPGEPRRGASLLSILASSALAALAVIVLVGVLILAFGTDDDPEAEQAAPVATASPAPGQPAAPTPTPASATPTPRPTPRPAAKVPVVVFNQTTVRGLGQTFADDLTAGGWTVAGVDDWRGNVPATTVYFPPGLRPVAKALMGQFPQIGRIRPAFAGISSTQLTVILSKDFPTSG